LPQLRTVASVVQEQKPSAVSYLYVANAPFYYSSNYGVGTPSVGVYAAGGLRQLRTITKSLRNPTALTVDASQDLYVADRVVKVYKPGGTALLRTITKGVSDPIALAIAGPPGTGNLFVLNGGSNSVTTYLAGTTRPLRTISSGIANPIGMTLVNGGNLYVLNGCGSGCYYSSGASGPPYIECSLPGFLGSVSVYAPGAKTPELTITSGIHAPMAMLVDPAGDVIVANLCATDSSSSAGSVSIYPPGQATPAVTITQGVGAPTALAIGDKGQLFVASSPHASSGGGFISVYAPGSTKPGRTITGLETTGVLAIGPSGDLFVASQGARGSVSEYSPSGAKLLHVVTKKLNVPTALVFGQP
jgi:hypothetical protein